MHLKYFTIYALALLISGFLSILGFDLPAMYTKLIQDYTQGPAAARGVKPLVNMYLGSSYILQNLVDQEYGLGMSYYMSFDINFQICHVSLLPSSSSKSNYLFFTVLKQGMREVFDHPSAHVFVRKKMDDLDAKSFTVDVAAKSWCFRF